MKIPLYQVDAFADRVFAGNPAAVCPLERWLDDDVLQNIAAENNLAATAFFAATEDGFHIRWFTPRTEIDLCGHATLASAFVIFDRLGFGGKAISFQSRSGVLRVSRSGEWLTLNFPADHIENIGITGEYSACVNKQPVELYRGKTDLMFVLSRPEDVESITPDFRRLGSLKERGAIVTSAGRDTDFISRFFAPAVGVNEDPVTGSAHTTLIPYWSKRLRKTEMTARQVSERGGYLKCKYLDDRVEISGRAAFYLAGEISI
jgi:PhzF family phenazine biosynthesis protein